MLSAPSTERAVHTNGRIALDAFLADKCDATKAKYAAELENAREWSKPLDYWYAESLVYFGLLKLRVIEHLQGKIICGSHAEYRQIEA